MQTEVYFAIPMPSIEMLHDQDYDAARTRLYDTLDELSSLSEQLIFDLNEFGISRPRIEFIESETRNEETTSKLLQWFAPEHLENSEFMSIGSEVGETDALPKDFQPTLFTTWLEKRITDLLLIANLCRLGSIETDKSVTLLNGQLLPYSALPKINCWHLQRAAELVEKTQWPNFKTLPIKVAWEWAVAHKTAFEGFDGTSLGRAISAFSRLFETEDLDEAMHLVWALIGIEALYVRGKNSIMEQVREKVYALLGEPESHKKRIAAMYEFRSRFIHGDLDFAPLVIEGDARREVERYDSEQSEAIETAVAILAATLQEIISRKWSGLDFSYGVTNSD